MSSLSRAWTVCLPLAGCSLYFGDGSDDTPAPDGFVEVANVSVTVNRALDLLFVIDDSPSMLDKQTNLKAAFPTLVRELSQQQGGLPDLHIGVVSSDLGSKGALDAVPGPGIGSGPGSCSGNGKAGTLLTNGTTLVAGKFISDTGNSDGSRTTNYTGTLADAFSAIASVGAAGCGFEQHAEAAKRALQNNPANAGFVRPHANLGVIVVADEDDCSLARSTLLSADTGTLGPLQSFRCTRFGVTCDEGGKTPDDMNKLGAKSACHSNETSDYLMPISDYAAYFKGLKDDPRKLMLAAIIGEPSSVAVELRTPPGGGTAIPGVSHVCGYNSVLGPEVADPGVRLRQLAASFARNTIANVCTSDLGGTMSSIGRQLRAMTGDTCFVRDIALPADCTIADTLPGLELPLPACGPGVSRPCHKIVEDPVYCPSGQHLKIVVERSEAPSPDTAVVVRCRI